MNRVALIVLLAFVGTAARAADPAADELKKLQGEWQAVELEVKGQKLGKNNPEVENMRFVFKDDELTVKSAAGAGERKKTFKLDPTKTPREIDITSLDGQEKDTTAACIYKFEKDRLTICMPYFKDSTDRPKEFKAGADDGRMLITLERVKLK